MTTNEIINICLVATQAIFTGLIFLVTRKYTKATDGMLDEMKEERESRVIPKVNLRFIHQGENMYDLEIKNISEVEIYDLNFEDHNYSEMMINDHQNMSDLGFIKNGIKYLGVEQEYCVRNINVAKLITFNRGITTFEISEGNTSEFENLIFEMSFYSENEANEERKKIKKTIEINLGQFSDSFHNPRI